MQTKTCSKCGIDQPITNFHKDNHHTDKLTSHCKSCCSVSRKQYRKENPIFCWCIDTIHSHKKEFKVLFKPIELLLLAEKTKTCIYCGCELQYGYNKKGSPYKTSPSLDRINNEQFLSLDNVEIICHDCNAIKRCRTKNEFIDYCKKVGELPKL
jgi:hypothetical protein